ncbi:Retrieval of early ER protein Rer1 protein [Dioscorea alata]|uniref:Retrieval of early ER protein Rer1 protein n=1 Tax=Dioscorea alata TaxID=55571 RepID=A0ACB7WKM3_DIOAL|nr:Retrieval of early ER protein Rer1 protein [Dioscorea alata]
MVPEVAAQPSEGSPAPPPESMAETGAPARPGIGAGFFSSWTSICRRYQYYLDKSTPFVGRRWAGAAVLALIYFIRVLILQGFYIVTYALAIFVLNLLIGFLSPQVDPETQALLDGSGPGLPIKSTDEFRPFVRRLPEFKFWHSIVKAFSIAFVMTFFSVFDVPVFWPILLFYWIVLFTVTMKRQIIHMIKYKYVPFTFGKQRYTGKKVPSADDLDLAN